MDVFSPAALNRVVDDLKNGVSGFLLSAFFQEISVSNQEEIFFDIDESKPRLSPFVSPLVEGQIVQNEGYTTKSFRPAYIKDKRIFEDGKAVKRRIGQPIAAPIDPMTNRLLQIADATDDQLKMLTRRCEWMASEVLRTGGVTVSGEKYPTTFVDFGRDASLTVTLSGTARWDQGAADPVGDLEDWSLAISDLSGASATTVLMPSNVFKIFRANTDVKDLLDQSKKFDKRTTLNLGPNAPQFLGAQYKGQVGDFEIWTYTEQYVDDNGATQKFLPDDYIIMASQQLEGVQHYGGIKDEAAGFQARDFFQKSWTTPDPAVRWLMLQSAPLVVPYRVNATLSAKVRG